MATREEKQLWDAVQLLAIPTDGHQVLAIVAGWLRSPSTNYDWQRVTALRHVMDSIFTLTAEQVHDTIHTALTQPRRTR